MTAVNAVQRLWDQSARDPDRFALRIDGDEWTYGELRDETADWGGRLRKAGISPGDRVLLVAGTHKNWIFSYHAILAVGAVAVTVNPLSTAVELSYFLQDSGARLLLADDGTLAKATTAATPLHVPVWNLTDCEPDSSEVLDSPHRIEPGAGAVIMYTSGTTGKPKGALLTHHGITMSSECFVEALRVTRDDHFGTALPLFHVFGQATVMRTAFDNGAGLSLLSKFDATALLELASKHQVTLLTGVPTMWNAMLNADFEITPEAFARLRLAISGGAGLPAEFSRRFQEAFDCILMTGYGLTETTGVGACPRVGWPRKPDSAGVALPGVQIAIFDGDRHEVPHGTVGEIAVKTPTMLKAYWNRPEATAEAIHDGWFFTGDLGKVDDEGYLWMVDRKKDLIIRGGYNVYPKELEEVLYTHPDVLEAAVVGIPDDHLGEEIAAVIVPRAGASFDIAGMRDWFAERSAPYKTPRIYHVVEELPKGSTGKILKRKIDRDVVQAEGRRTTAT